VPKPRIIPAAGVDEDAISDLADRENWLLANIVPRSDDAPFEKVWVTEDGESAVHYLDDHPIGVDYLFALGPRRDELAQRIRDGLHTLDREDVLRAWATAEDKWEAVGAIYRAAVLAPEVPDAQLLEIFEQAAHHEAPEVRIATALAAHYAAWPELRSQLEELQADADPEVREAAAEILRSLAATEWAGDGAG
jgi:hypothetical protein